MYSLPFFLQFGKSKGQCTLGQRSTGASVDFSSLVSLSLNGLMPYSYNVHFKENHYRIWYKWPVKLGTGISLKLLMCILYVYSWNWKKCHILDHLLADSNNLPDWFLVMNIRFEIYLNNWMALNGIPEILPKLGSYCMNRWWVQHDLMRARLRHQNCYKKLNWKQCYMYVKMKGIKKQKAWKLKRLY